MIYTCENCGFLFCRMSEVKECPSCQKHNIRPADMEESQRLPQIFEEKNKKILEGVL